MNSREQFKPVGRFEATDQIGHLVEALACRFVVGKELACFSLGARHEFQGLFRYISAIGIARDEMPFNGIQYVAKILRIGAVVGRFELQTQRFPRLLQKVHELVDFQQRYGRVEQAFEVTGHQLHERRSAGRHLGSFTLVLHLVGCGGTFGFVQQYFHLRQGRKRLFDTRPDVIPFQSTQTAAEGRNRNGLNVVAANDFNQVDQAGFDIFHAAVATPMTLGRKIDDEPRVGKLTGGVDEHSARLHLLPLASRFISFEVLRVGFLELQRNTPPHDADAVHGIDQSLCISVENVSACVFNHCSVLIQ